MIAKLKGIIDEISSHYLILDVAGVGYLIYASNKTLSQIGQTGGQATLLIETHVREDHIHLYGFASKEEKEWFSLLCTVQGVGTKVALAILSATSTADLLLALSSGDQSLLTRAEGVGPKLASRLITELKDKAGKISVMGMATDFLVDYGEIKNKAGEADHEAISALVNLGYSQSQAYMAVSKVKQSNDEITDVGQIIQQSLKQLAQG